MIGSGVSPTIGAALITSRASSVLSYLAQFQPPPIELISSDVAVVERLLHMPGRVLSRKVASCLEFLMKLTLPLPGGQRWAALTRATFESFSSLRHEALDLIQATEPHLSFDDFFSGAPFASILTVSVYPYSFGPCTVPPGRSFCLAGGQASG